MGADPGVDDLLLARGERVGAVPEGVEEAGRRNQGVLDDVSIPPARVLAAVDELLG